MPTLDAYLGGILVSLNRARVMADVQTVETAESYAKHDLLRHFAVPRLRFGDVELSIPVALDALNATGRSGIEPEEREAVHAAVLDRLPKLIAVRSLPRAAVAAISEGIDAQLKALDDELPHAPLEASLDRFAESLAKRIMTAVEVGDVKAPIDRIDRAALAKGIRADVGAAVTPQSGKPVVGGLEVIAESHKLREQRPSDMITIKLRISEDGVEWQHIERSDGTVERKLLPE